MDTLPSLIARLRSRVGLSAPDVAKALNVGRSTVYSWEAVGVNGRLPEDPHLTRFLDLVVATPAERLQAYELRAAAAGARDEVAA